MKRVFSLALIIVLCLAVASPAFAAKQEFVPSISYKDHPEIVPVPGDPGSPSDKVIVAEIINKDDKKVIEDIHEEYLVITPVSDAEDSTEIPEESKKQLLDIYEQLTEGTMEIPYDKIDPSLDPNNMVIRDLFDVSSVNSEHKLIVNDDGKDVRITFDLGVNPDTDVYVMTYIDDEWIPAVSVVNNGDGTVTIVINNFGPVIFAVKGSGSVTPPAQTGDQVGSMLPVWISVMAVAAVGLIVVLVLGRRKKQ